jgi:phosphinothricin acetyltransferase
MNHSIRLAVPSDSEEILTIYAPYVTDTAVSVETEVPSVRDFAARIEGISAQYPYLVYTVDDKIVGYAYASKFRERAAYRFGVETSIYVSDKHHGGGIAGKLYACLFALLGRQGYKIAYAGYSEPNEKSRKFHSKCDFHVVGTYRNTGYKLGKWVDVTWMEKALGEFDANPKEPIPIGSIPIEEIEIILSEALSAR